MIMNRRNFASVIGLTAGAFMMPSLGSASTKAPLIKPKALQKGDKVGLLTPASAISRTSFQKALENLQSFGFEVVYSKNMRVKKGFLAGTDAQRLDDLHSMFVDDSIKGIVCARGGYGSARLLTSLDYDLIKANPKVLLGYSDITALLQAIHVKTGLVTFHGPVGASEFNKFTTKSFEKVLLKGNGKYSFDTKDGEGQYEKYTLVNGQAKGPLIGGNLSLITSLLGTPYDIDYTDKIVFIEEIGESPYRVDRMLTQLLNSGKLSKARAIALGIFHNCETKPSDPDFGDSLSLKEVLQDRLGELAIPVAYGLPIGHIAHNATIPIGIEAAYDSEKNELQYLEEAVS